MVTLVNQESHCFMVTLVIQESHCFMVTLVNQESHCFYQLNAAVCHHVDNCISHSVVAMVTTPYTDRNSLLKPGLTTVEGVEEGRALLQLREGAL